MQQESYYAQTVLDSRQASGDQDLETLQACPLCDQNQFRILDASANICECACCGYIFDNPRPTIEALVAFYSNPTKYDSWLSEELARNLLWERRLRQVLRIRKPGSLLDVGAGIGQFLDLARPYFSEVQGTEVSASAVEIARKRYGLELIQGEIHAINFGCTYFDNITVYHVLEHVPDPKLLIQKCASLLSDRGVLVIAVPNEMHSLRTRARGVLNAMGILKSGNIGRLGLPRIVLDGTLAEIHLSHFTPQVLARLVKSCGLSVVSNTLDPYYAATGFTKWKEGVYYRCCGILQTLARVNLYETILIVARKERFN